MLKKLIFVNIGIRFVPIREKNNYLELSVPCTTRKETNEKFVVKVEYICCGKCNNTRKQTGQLFFITLCDIIIVFLAIFPNVVP